MAKRYTNTNRWLDEWFLSLSNDYKVIWLWLNDNCDHAGILKKGVTVLNFCCKTNIQESDLMEVFSNKLIEIDEGYFIPGFLKLQYRNLNSNKPAIISVINILIEHNLVDLVKERFGDDFIIIPQSLSNDCQTIKDTEKGKEDKEEEIPSNILERHE